MLVAPVNVGDDAYTGAGSVITEDVPAGALGIERAEQRNVEGYAEKTGEESAGRGVDEHARRAPHGRQLDPPGLHQAPDGVRRPRLDGAGGEDRRPARPRPRPRRPSTFSDGEVYCRYEESIRGADVFLVQSTAANEAHGMTPNDALMELLVMIDAAQGASAHRIIAVMPWFGYARQDKKSQPREPISARVVAKCAGGGRRGPGAGDGPPLRPGAGVLRGPRRPHDRDADADPVLHGPGVHRGAGDRLARRRPSEGGAQLRPQDRLSTGR